MHTQVFMCVYAEFKRVYAELTACIEAYRVAVRDPSDLPRA